MGASSQKAQAGHGTYRQTSGERAQDTKHERHTMRETPSSVGGEGGREDFQRRRDHLLLKENQTRFGRKNRHSGQRGGGEEVIESEDHGCVAQGLEWCLMHRNSRLIKNCSFFDPTRYVCKYSLNCPFRFYV